MRYDITGTLFPIGYQWINNACSAICRALRSVPAISEITNNVARRLRFFISSTPSLGPSASRRVGTAICNVERTMPMNNVAVVFAYTSIESEINELVYAI